MSKITWDNRTNTGSKALIDANIFNETKQAVNALYDTVEAQLGTTSSTDTANLAISGNIYVSGSIIPSAGDNNTSSFNLGSPTAAWKEIYVATSSLNFVDSEGNITKWSKDDVTNLKAGKSLSTIPGKQLINENDDTTYVRMSTAGRAVHYAGGNAAIDIKSDKVTLGGLDGASTGLPVSFAKGITGSLNITGSTNITGSVVVTGSFTVTDLLNVLANYSQTGSFSVSGSTTLAGDVNMDGAVNLNDLLTVLGGFNASGGITNTGSFNNSGSFYNDGTGSFTGSLWVTGSVTASKNNPPVLITNGDNWFYDSLFISGALYIGTLPLDPNDPENSGGFSNNIFNNDDVVYENVFVQGEGNSVAAKYGFARGQNNIIQVSAKNAAALGEGLYGVKSNATYLGQFNAPNTTDFNNAYFVVGSGADGASRKNSLQISAEQTRFWTPKVYLEDLETGSIDDILYPNPLVIDIFGQVHRVSSSYVSNAYTASAVSDATITLTYNDGTTTELTINNVENAETASYVPNAIYTASITDNTITLTQFDGDTINLTIDTAPTAFTSASVSDATLSLTQSNGTITSLTVNNVENANTASQVANALTNGNGIQNFTFDGSSTATVALSNQINITGITASLQGNVTGNLTGNVTGDLTGTASVATDVINASTLQEVTTAGSITTVNSDFKGGLKATGSATNASGVAALATYGKLRFNVANAADNSESGFKVENLPNDPTTDPDNVNSLRTPLVVDAAGNIFRANAQFGTASLTQSGTGEFAFTTSFDNGSNFQVSEGINFVLSGSDYISVTNPGLTTAQWNITSQFQTEISGAINSATSSLSSSITTTINTIESNITTIEGDIITIESDIVDLQTASSSFDSSITTIEGDIIDLQTASSSFNTSITDLELASSSFDSSITDLELASSSFDTSITNLEVSASTGVTFEADSGPGFTLSAFETVSFAGDDNISITASGNTVSFNLTGSLSSEEWDIIANPLGSGENASTALRIALDPESNSNPDEYRDVYITSRLIQGGAFNSSPGYGGHAEGYDTTNSGAFAHAEGSGSITKGTADYSHAEGYNTVTWANYSHAEGTSTQAYGLSSHAEGQTTYARGNYSHTEGTSTVAWGIGSHAEGYNTYTHPDYNNAHAEGNATSASGDYSHAEGYQSKTTGTFAHAEGRQTLASGTSAHAEGRQTLAEGGYSHAEGYLAHSRGDYSHAEGHDTYAAGDYVHVEGWQTTATQDYAHAEGRQTTASGQASHAEGRATYTLGGASHAEGYNTRAMQTYAHSEGYNSIAWGIASHVEGHNNNAFGSYSHAEGGSTTTSTLAIYAHAEGYNTVASASYAHAEGFASSATGEGSHAEGLATSATKDYSHAEGARTIAQGYHSHAEGEGTLAIGTGSHAEGHSTTASGDFSHAAGFQSRASGYYSYASGRKSTASGIYSHAGGYENIASGEQSFAQGNSSQAIGDGAATFGLRNYARGNYTTTFGNGTETHADSTYTTVVGVWNQYDSLQQQKALFIIGNGDGDGSRDNVAEFHKDRIILDFDALDTQDPGVEGQLWRQADAANPGEWFLKISAG